MSQKKAIEAKSCAPHLCAMPMPGAAPVMKGLMPQLNQKRDVAFVDSHTVRDTVKLKNWISSSKQSKVVQS